MKKKNYWHKLDNAAKIFPAVSTDKRSNVFRLSVYIDHDVDINILKTAVMETLERFQIFATRLKNGFFWHYFAENNREIKIEKESSIVCKYFNGNESQGYLFKIYTLNNKISLETHHSLTDGYGGLEFLKSILYKYFKSLDDNINHEGLILSEIPLSNKENEDVFNKRYNAKKRTKLTEEKAYHVTGEKFRDNWNLVIKYQFQKDQLIKMIKDKYQITVTQYFNACLAYAIYLEGVDVDQSKKPIKIFIPVNLRPYFNTQTLRNFSLYVKTSFHTLNKTWTFKEMIDQIKSEYQEQLNADDLLSRLSSNVALEKNIFIRILPLFLKLIAFKIGYHIIGSSTHTSSLSNLGIINLPTSMQVRILDFEFITAGSGITGSAITYRNNINLVYTSVFKDTSILQKMAQIFKEDGLNVIIDTNYQEGYDEIL